MTRRPPQRSTRPSHRAPLVEPLEGRRLLAGLNLDGTTVTTAEDVNIKVNFQPATTSPGPTGFLLDVGRGYADRRGGWRYGWVAPNESGARDRNSPLSPHDGYDTFNHLDDDTGRWAIAVPDGRYRVRVVAGDANYTNSFYDIDVEGTQAVRAAPTDAERWVGGVVEVDVADGGLTITSGADAENNKITFIEVTGIRSATPAGVSIDWEQSPTDAPRARVEPGGIQVGNQLFVIGGTQNTAETTRAVDILDLTTGTWSSGRPIPADAADNHAGYTTDNRRFIYWVAGQLGPTRSHVATNTAWRYDFINDEWSRYVDLPAVRYAGGMAYVDGMLHFAGGANESRSVAARDHWALDTQDPGAGWSRRAPLPLASDHHGMAVVRGRIYAIGGEDDHGKTYTQHAKMYAYDPATDRWSERADLPIASSHFEGTVRTIGRKVFIFAGRIDRPTERTDKVSMYDSLTNTWHELDPLPDARLGAVAAIVGDRVYFANGYSTTLGDTTRAYWGTLSGI